MFMTSLTSLCCHTLDGFIYFVKYEKRGPIPKLWYQLDASVGQFSSYKTHGKLCYRKKKGLVRRGISIMCTYHSICVPITRGWQRHGGKRYHGTGKVLQCHQRIRLIFGLRLRSLFVKTDWVCHVWCNFYPVTVSDYRDFWNTERW